MRTDGALLSHRSAAALWGLRPPGAAVVEVTVRAVGGAASAARESQADRLGIARSASPALEAGIPVACVAWTLLDLAAVPSAGHRSRRAVEEADRLELFDLRAVHEALEADPHAPGRRPCARSSRT